MKGNGYQGRRRASIQNEAECDWFCSVCDRPHQWKTKHIRLCKTKVCIGCARAITLRMNRLVVGRINAATWQDEIGASMLVPVHGEGPSPDGLPKPSDELPAPRKEFKDKW